MSRQREICAVQNTVGTDAIGALDCILHAIEIAMADAISKEKGAIYNEKADKH